MLVGGGRRETPEQAAARLGMPLELIMEAEGFQQSGDEIFSENVPVVGVFMDMLTQWRVGPGGVVGLDYNVLPMLFDVRRVAVDDRGDILDGLKIMEAAALETIREKD